MCGRYNLVAQPGEIYEEFRIRESLAPFAFGAVFNAAPTQPLPVVRLENGAPVARLLRWGLVPAWSDTARPSYSTICARAEHAAVRPAFRASWRRRRCLVPATGWYEWQRRGDRPTPHAIRPRDGGLLAFAGLWDRWEGNGGATVLETFSIVTVPAARAVAAVHNRMPALLGRGAQEAWLDPATPVDALGALVGQGDPRELVAYRVSTLVNSVRNNRPECLAPAISSALVAA